MHDWAARIPVALSAIGLCWVTAGLEPGLSAAGPVSGGPLYVDMSGTLSVYPNPASRCNVDALHCVGALGISPRSWTTEEKRPGLWAAVLAASLAAGLLLKSLIGVVFPIGAIVFTSR